jgi:hypothetical protein
MNLLPHRNMFDKTLFIVGAGFSCHAGMPLVQNLREEVKNLLDRNAASDPRISVHMGPLDNWPEFPDGKFWAGLQRVDPHDNRGFEEWMVDLLKAADTFPACVQTFHVLRRACALLLWEKQASLVSLPEAYYAFAQRARDSLGVISFNWDLVCERALKDTGVPWGYSSRTAPLAVIKPHGSLNWTNHLQQVDNGRRIINPIGFARIAPQSTLSFMPSLPFEDPLLGQDSDDLRCITFPGDLESFDSTQRPRAATDQELLWTETSELIAKAATIVFIGYSLPSYDALARRQLQAACQGKLIEVYNPSCKALSEFRSVFGDATIKFIPVKFEESSFAERPGHSVIQSS